MKIKQCFPKINNGDYDDNKNNANYKVIIIILIKH